MTMTCDQCPEPAVVFVPGDAGESCDMFLLRGIPLRCLCLAHATAAGWPWITSEQPKRRKAVA
jgi:hypothetical protein